MYNLIEYHVDHNIPLPKLKPKKFLYTQYIKNNMYYEFHENSRKTYTKDAVDVVKEDGITKMYFNKTKIPFYMFPCTTSLNEIAHVTKTSYCVHTNVYFNIEKYAIENEDGTVTEKPFKLCYISVVLDNKVDKKILDSIVDRLLLK
jgi:hypothetical protein